jgi:hypothetical protein
MSGVHPSRTVGAPSYWSQMCHFRTFAADEVERARSVFGYAASSSRRAFASLDRRSRCLR